VAAASIPEVIRPGLHGRPHLDLGAAAAAQLMAQGVTDVRQLDLCTRCHPDQLWSYRRDGQDAGRNLALIWSPAQLST
jgi:copper oxidase (laccase) domain-containing protein